ncbi:MAG: hypothetical protein RhofKO_42590 [Rhodothermales bacterium]
MVGVNAEDVRDSGLQSVRIRIDKEEKKESALLGWRGYKNSHGRSHDELSDSLQVADHGDGCL